jgi:ABC-type multidrug transport system fused ATPase/permease subunit
MADWLDRRLFRRAWLTFIVMVVAFLVFGAGTYNLFLLLKANLELIAEHGMQALADGAAQQFVELMFTAALSMAAYVLFKACEHRLVQRLCQVKKADS